MTLAEIFTFENLYESHKNCRKSKQQKGEVIRFESNLSSNLIKMEKELLSQKYELGAYKKFIIYEPKKRIIEAPSYKDRVVIRCFCDYCLKEKIEKKLIYDNAACRKEKGTKFAMERLEKFLRSMYVKQKNNNFYFLKCDIQKYFPSINHEILLKILRDMGFSKEEIGFIKKLMQVTPTGEGVGLPLGNQSSQWFALIYLNSLDRLIKEKLRVKYYVRYMDDMILLSENKEYLQNCQKEIEKHCNTQLLLQLNQKTQIGKVKNGIDFLGYRHIVTQTGKINRKLRNSSRQRMQKHLRVLKKLRNRKIVDNEYVSIRKKAFYNHLRKTNESLKLKREVMSRSK